MFESQRYRTPIGAAYATFDLIFHSTVRSIRKSHGNAVLGLLLNIAQSALMILVFYVLMTLMGTRSSAAIRGDFLVYMMTGVFVFMTHTKTMGAVAGAGSATSAMLHHAPMTTAVAIAAAALSSLYIQALTMGALLYGYHVLFSRITIDQPVEAAGMVLLAWAYGVALGLVLLAARPWNPRLVAILQMIYARVNLIASGKMFVANSLSFKMVAFFDWNPLFHIIDQIRGYTFLNYYPHYTSVTYPVYVMLAVLCVGMMGEFYTRKYASLSWGARG